jgi:ComF family protein
MWTLLKHFWDFLFPKKASVITLEKLSPTSLRELLPKNRHELGDGSYAIFDYQHSLTKEVVWEIKYKGNRILAENAGVLLYDEIVSELAERNWWEKFDSILLIPSPISDRRRLERGWNQAELLAEAVKFCDHEGRFRYTPGQLIKLSHTESQARTENRAERLSNLKNSMGVRHPQAVADRAAVLVDDVVTTGATLAEARRALKEAGVKKILCFALAH